MTLSLDTLAALTPWTIAAAAADAPDQAADALARGANPAIACALAAGLAVVDERGRASLRDALTPLAPDERARALHELDPLLCHIDPRWAWTLAREHAAAYGAMPFAILAAHARGAVDVPLPATLATTCAAADRVVAALDGRDDDGAPWTSLWGDARALALAAIAVRAPGDALEALFAARALCPVTRVPGVVACAVHRLTPSCWSGEDQVTIAALGAATCAAWVGELARGGARPTLLADDAAGLADAVEESADPGEALVDGWPLIEGLVATGRGEAAVALAARWGCEAPRFASLWCERGDRVAPTLASLGDGDGRWRHAASRAAGRPWPAYVGSVRHLVELLEAARGR